ncbi:hypothetical protein FB565_000276 [Actinoplanes lutulentus]|uniref:hypothetical protein n=1 Tax=Actinoplanes lutulentus TaxID=1287878 RepID=UPI0015EC6EEF|nr:hypothetical protein [Actinoplanes lutulentus]MBB2940572.1 hypothetical protein [Actinoplanes lutulentus]
MGDRGADAPVDQVSGPDSEASRGAIIDAILQVVHGGCSWRQRILEELREQLRLAEGRDAQPSAGVMDSQSVKAADTVSRGSRGCDPGKKINIRNRFIVTDILGLLAVVCVMSASWHDPRRREDDFAQHLSVHAYPARVR